VSLRESLTNVSDRVLDLDFGADDYLGEPRRRHRNRY
jgi:DNA-binding response OmpR family regulator